MTLRISRRTWLAEVVDRALGGDIRAEVDGPGIGVLAGLVGELGDAALVHWLGAFRGGSHAAGAFGLGQAGFAAGLAMANDVEPRLTTLAAHARRGVVDWARGLRPEPDALRWQDYDLIAGPAGALLALTVTGHGTPEEIGPLAEHLARLASAEDLAGLRLDGYAADPLRGWNQDSINLGLGHGVPGVVVALAAARRVLGPRPPLLTALRNCADLLVGTAATDARGMPVWGPADRAGAGRSRQAWCYGAPGIAWALWEAGQTLADPRVSAVATETMAGLDRRWDPDRQLHGDTPADLVGVCHGAAGVLAVADAFARHAGHAPSARLRARLVDWLRRRAELVDELASTNLTLLDGAAGVFAVLLTVEGGCRRWLPLLGLR